MVIMIKYAVVFFAIGAHCDLISRIKDNVDVSMSTVFQNWTAERAIDGEFVAEPTICRCCAGTMNDYMSWWKIDLGLMYPLMKMVVYGRVNDIVFQQLTGFDLVLKNSTTADGEELYSHTLKNDTIAINVPNTLTRIIEIRRPGLLTICEIQIYEGVCALGRFGEECSQTCHCGDRKPCDRNTGRCVSPICENGYTGEACDKDCPAQHFGEGCSHRCYCTDAANCTKDNGICPDGCAAGYRGAHCEDHCQDGKYGQECASTCGQCFENQPCDYVTGRCPGECNNGYYGPFCLQDLLQRIKTQTRLLMSSVHLNWNAEKAVDQVYSANPDTCSCCAGTDNEVQSWWKVNLGQMYPLEKVIVYSRMNESLFQHLNGFDLILMNNSIDDDMIVSANTVVTSKDMVEIGLSNTLSQLIEIRRAGKLTICEVLVIEGDCRIGTFGDECSQVCHCADKKPCDKQQGTCETPLCHSGYFGDSCDKECPFQQFGQGCVHRCFCAGGDDCSKDYGICPGLCAAGYEGVHCENKCPVGTYGSLCAMQCGVCRDNMPCNHINGMCTGGCRSGYTGQFCKQECEFQFFGRDCKYQCHCSNDQDCTKDQGVCPDGCAAGYIGVHCEKECQAGKYGLLCTFECGMCFGDNPCDHVTGKCLDGCNPGYTGQFCNKETDLLRRIKDNLKLSMSSVHENWIAENAVDQTNVANADSCSCCAGTQNSLHSWWNVDLGKMYSLKAVKIYGRENENNFKQLSGFRLFVSNASSNSNEKLVYSNNVINDNYCEIILDNILARSVKIERPGILTICEVKILEGDCPVGRFGEECLQQCHCADRKLCNRNSGRCQTPICKIGFINEACSEECPIHYFGQKCLQQCFCADNADCTKEHGICPGACAPGYEGAHCGQACGEQKYGYGCAQTCGNCAGQQSCDHVTGLCEFGCSPGYLGQFCREALNLLENIRPNITMSSIYLDWKPERTIDGNVGPNPTECQCCSSTQNEVKSWWKAEFKQLYSINQLLIYGRKNEQDYDQLQSFRLFLQNDTAAQTNPFYVNDEMTMDFVNITVPNILAKVIIIERTGRITICEVKAFEGDCAIGRYGDECSKYCNCADKKRCDKYSGKCLSPRCSDGWSGEACNEVCPHWYYGRSCAFECGMCAWNVTCHSITGACTSGCDGGYTGSYCADKEQVETEEKSQTGLIVGLTVPLLVIIFCGLAAAAFYYFRCRKQNRGGQFVKQLRRPRRLSRSIISAPQQPQQEHPMTNIRDSEGYQLEPIPNQTPVSNIHHTL